MIKNKYANLTKDIFIFVIGIVLAKMVQFFLLPLYTSHMSTEAYGVAELNNNLSDFLFPIITLNVYEGSFRYAVEKEFSKGNIVRTFFSIIISSFLISLIFTFLLYYIFDYKYAFYLLLIVFSYSIRMVLSYYIRGKGLSKEFSISGIINAIVLGIFSVIFLVKLDKGVIGYLLAIGLAHIISALYLFFSGKIIDDLRDYCFDYASFKKDFRIILDYSLPLIVYNTFYWIVTFSGRYILLFFKGSGDAGIYISAIKISAVINALQQAVYSAVQLNNAIEFEKTNKEQYYEEIFSFFSELYCLLGSFIIICSPIIAKITLKNDFYIGGQYLPLILFSSIVNCISSNYGSLYSTYKKTKRQVIVGLLGALVNVCLCLVLVPNYGIYGVCISSVGCYFTQLLYKIIDIERITTIKFEKKKLVIYLLTLFIQVLFILLYEKWYLVNIPVFIFLLFMSAFKHKDIIKRLKGEKENGEVIQKNN